MCGRKPNLKKKVLFVFIKNKKRKYTNSSTTLCGDPQYRIGFWQNWWHAITRSPILRFFFCDIYTLFIASPYLRKKSLKEEKEAFIHPYFPREKVPWCFCIFPRLPYIETPWDVLILKSFVENKDWKLKYVIPSSFVNIKINGSALKKIYKLRQTKFSQFVYYSLVLSEGEETNKQISCTQMRFGLLSFGLLSVSLLSILSFWVWGCWELCQLFSIRVVCIQKLGAYLCNLFHILDIFHARFTMCLTCPEWKLLVLLGSRGASRSCLTSSKLLENWGKKVQPSHMGVKWFQKEHCVHNMFLRCSLSDQSCNFTIG